MQKPLVNYILMAPSGALMIIATFHGVIMDDNLTEIIATNLTVTGLWVFLIYAIRLFRMPVHVKAKIFDYSILIAVTYGLLAMTSTIVSDGLLNFMIIILATVDLIISTVALVSTMIKHIRII